jgi:hypothetical protein
MKKSPHVIRVSAAPARDRVPLLASWLDAVQVRACSTRADAEPAPAAPELSRGGARPAELSDRISFKIL